MWCDNRFLISGRRAFQTRRLWNNEVMGPLEPGLVRGWVRSTGSNECLSARCLGLCAQCGLHGAGRAVTVNGSAVAAPAHWSLLSVWWASLLQENTLRQIAYFLCLLNLLWSQLQMNRGMEQKGFIDLIFIGISAFHGFARKNIFQMLAAGEWR